MAKITILDQFLAKECTPDVRDLVRSALEAGKRGAGPRRKRFEFNRFDVTFDLDEGDVLIEDVLDATEAGAQRVLLAEFSTALNSRPG